MAFRTEISLEELLAEPMVRLLMKKDGVSVGEARALYAGVQPRFRVGAEQERSRTAASPSIAPWAVRRPDQVSPCL
jgi:hypothetical protein